MRGSFNHNVNHNSHILMNVGLFQGVMIEGLFQ